MTAGDQTVDVVVVGSGSGGLVAALAARADGVEPLLIEKSAYPGGGISIGQSSVFGLIAARHAATRRASRVEVGRA